MTVLKRPPADPFLQNVRMPYRAVLNVFGVPVEFESNARWLLALADDAYGALPTCAPPRDAQIRVRLLANAESLDAFKHPPHPRVYADGNTVSVIVTPADTAICVPALGSALITVSPAMRAFPHHVRYELIEFACYRLVSYHLNAVGLHAACVAKNDRAWLIFGESGAGKSTLTFACLQRGWDLIAEDSVFVLLDDPAEVRGVPTFIHLLDDSLRFFPNVQIKSQLIMRRSGATKHEIDIRTMFGQPMQVCAPLAGLIFLEARRESSMPKLRLLKPSVAMKRLIHSQPFAPNYPRWSQALSLTSRLPAFAFASGTDVWHSVDAIERIGLDSAGI